MHVSPADPGIRVMLVDAHWLVLSGLQRLIDEKKPHISVVATAASCAAALSRLSLLRRTWCSSTPRLPGRTMRPSCPPDQWPRQRCAICSAWSIALPRNWRC